MITVFSDKHRLRNAKTELYGGQLVTPFESPSRAEIVLERVKSEKLGEVIEPRNFGMDPVWLYMMLDLLNSCKTHGTNGRRQDLKVK